MLLTKVTGCVIWKANIHAHLHAHISLPLPPPFLFFTAQISTMIRAYEGLTKCLNRIKFSVHSCDMPSNWLLPPHSKCNRPPGCHEDGGSLTTWHFCSMQMLYTYNTNVCYVICNIQHLVKKFVTINVSTLHKRSVIINITIKY